MLVHWIWLATRPSVTDRVKRAIVERSRDAEDIYHADTDIYRNVEGMTEEGLQSLGDKDLRRAERIISQCSERDIHILTFRDAGYPAKLRGIPDPPMVLYYKGRLPDLESRPMIGVVGTRKASSYGLKVARRMGYQIAKCGGTVVSGMAFGIDGVAMKGALDAGGTAVGVLGCGADVVYPVSNRALFTDMGKLGCLLTEFPPETPPVKWNFPKRNRIISGISDGVLVVEAPERSGALITARQAAEQGRDVFAVPGNVDVETCAGSNELLRDGALAATSGWDILSEYQGAFPDTVTRYEGPVLPEMDKMTLKVAENVEIIDVFPPIKKKEIDNGAPKPYIDGDERLSEQERLIVERLKQGPCMTDELIAATGIGAGQLGGVLGMLEVRGILRRRPGDILALK